MWEVQETEDVLPVLSLEGETALPDKQGLGEKGIPGRGNFVQR